MASDSTHDGSRTGHPRLAVLTALLAPIGMIGGWLVGAALQPGGFDSTRESISALAAESTPHRWVMTTGLFLAALGHLLTAYALPRLPRRGRLVLGGGGLLTAAVGLAPLPSRTEGSTLHLVLAVLSLGVLSVWPFAGVLPAGPWPLRRRIAVAAGGGLVGLLLLLLLVARFDAETFGRWERVLVGAQSLWPLVVAFGVWWAAGHPIGRGAGRQALLFVPLVLSAGLGGAAATSVAPVTVQTAYYQAEVSLSIDPTDTGRLRVPTILGDIDVRFRGLAPGVIARPQVRADITDLLAKGVTGVDEFQPTNAELDRAVRAALPGLGLRYLGGALAGALLLAGLEAVVLPLWRRRSPASVRLRRVVLPSAAAAATVAVVTGVAVQQAYRPERYESFATSGLIGVAARNTDLLSQYETRTSEFTPYLRNLLALSSALETKYAAPTQSAVVTRILLVSDIHDANAYALMRTIVEAEDIDVVVDSGDIVDFGQPQELEQAGIPAGIEGLGVPYLFVRGNHDATSATDRAILDRLARVPNVVLLQPDPDNYQEVVLGGLRIAGFNDPRWYGDSGSAPSAAQKPARAAFEATFAGRAPLDVAVSHHPAAVRGLPRAAVLVNGHMHAADLEGNRIQVGTFTGGGPFNHFRTSAPGEELQGQPSAFDILGFGRDCRLSTLTRYTYRNVIEGRPVYDNVSLVNGSSVAPGEADPSRSCFGHAQAAVESVPRIDPTAADSPATPTSSAATTP